MSTPILTAPTETTGWLLEMTGTGDDTVYTVTRHDLMPPFDQSRLIAVALRVHNWWFVSLCDEPALKPLRFAEHDDAIAWLTHLANLYTRPVTA